ncbi:YaaA family protein [Clostridium sediminicola]|uniref:YaaA family protein n=1 Tax=Clostridium sediminicola TaxID=3114879 RepID=UPI0031F25DC6
MKIIISPSKTQDFHRKLFNKTETPLFINNADKIVKEIQKLSKKELAAMMKIKGKILDKTYSDYDNYFNNCSNHAISSYNGAVFKEINMEVLDKNDMVYAEKHLRILSALYGVLKPLDEIRPYRLDMNMKITNMDLYKFWQKNMDDYFSGEDLIINLASREFSKLINLPMVTIEFKEEIDGKYKIVGTYAKKARGMMVNFLIKNKIEDYEKIKEFTMDKYKYNKELSLDKKIVFSRKRV